MTYCRLIPRIKRKCDYGFMIFILTFNLVAVSGLRADKVIALARERLSTIGMGFAVCVFTSLLIFPMWASDELHRLTSSKFDKLACCIEDCMKAYFSVVNENESMPRMNVGDCKTVLHSKSSDESLVTFLTSHGLCLHALQHIKICLKVHEWSLWFSKILDLVPSFPKSTQMVPMANFARWEPWHGRFGLCYPWEKYIQIGELMREMASIIMSMQACLESPLQPSTPLQHVIKEPCKNVGLSLGLTMRELGKSIMNMKPCQAKTVTVPKLQAIKLELIVLSTSSKLKEAANVESIAVANFLFLLMKIVDKVEVLAQEVDALGEIAGFQSK
ncbi:putative aluminum-activated malate transporter [Helianthus anomalus]